MVKVVPSICPYIRQLSLAESLTALPNGLLFAIGIALVFKNPCAPVLLADSPPISTTTNRPYFVYLKYSLTDHPLTK